MSQECYAINKVSLELIGVNNVVYEAMESPLNAFGDPDFNICKAPGIYQLDSAIAQNSPDEDVSIGQWTLLVITIPLGLRQIAMSPQTGHTLYVREYNSGLDTWRTWT